MGNRGLALAGINANPMTVLASSSSNIANAGSNPNIAKATIENGVQVIKMTADGRGYTPNVFYVEKNKPVKWIIDGKQITSCNNAVVIPSLNKQQALKSGENVIEFTAKDKDINFSCWMGMIRGVIKVVDSVGAVDTSKPDASLPPAGSGMSCCGGGGAAAAPQKPSIYGDDLSKVETTRLVHKALVVGQYQSITIKGVGYELDPLIVVVNKEITTKLTFDLSAFDTPEGSFSIVDAQSGNTLTSFNGKPGVSELSFNPPKSGGCGIIKDGNLLGIIEAVDSLKAADLESIRAKYIN